MNKKYFGAVVCFTKAQDEILRRVIGPLSEGDGQSTEILTDLFNLSECLMGLSEVLQSDHAFAHTLAYDHKKNHKKYYEFEELVWLGKNSIKGILRNICCIGEKTAWLLDDIFVYLSMMGEGEPGSLSCEIVKWAHKRLDDLRKIYIPDGSS